jgi:hypothetical protein
MLNKQHFSRTNGLLRQARKRARRFHKEGVRQSPSQLWRTVTVDCYYAMTLRARPIRQGFDAGIRLVGDARRERRGDHLSNMLKLLICF